MASKLPWFRVYSEIVDDPKLADFSGDEFRIWVYLMALASEASDRGGTIRMDAMGIAWRTRQPIDVVTSTIRKCEVRGMVERVGEHVHLPNFVARQYDKPSDQPEETRERKQRSRARHAESRDGHALEERRGEESRGEESTLPGFEGAPEDQPSKAEKTAEKGKEPRGDRGPSKNQEFSTWFRERWTAVVGNGERYDFKFGKHNGLVKQLLELAGGDVEKVKARAEVFFADPWVRKRGATLELFRAQWARFAGAEERARSSEERYTPLGGDDVERSSPKHYVPIGGGD